MRCEDHPHALNVEHVAGDKRLRITAITEARREQNRRAQRAFRERKSAKKRFLPGTTPRRLAPCPLKLDWISLRGLVRSKSFTRPKTRAAKRPQPTGLLYHQIDVLYIPFPQTLFPALFPKHCSPYAELLRFTRDGPRPALWPHGVTATLAACLFNARALGIDIGRILDPQYISPFYRPSFSLVLATGSAAVQPTKLDIASDPQLAVLGPLRPCFAQVVFPHHACIDLLPLPRLRETAVMLHVRVQQDGGGATSPGFDIVQELKKDVYIRQGVRFCGTDELRGDEFTTYDDIGRHCGHPWERGSWAVAPWFARKRKYLVDV